MPIHALTIDVEDYFQVSNFERDISRADWDQAESRVVENTRKILHLLRDRDVRATFFVLGWVADRFPELVLEIDDDGHEIGSHSYLHRLVYEQTPDEFRDDLRRSRDLLEDILGKPVTAYRAPSFSITRRSLFALEILVEEGFRTDSSVFPVYHSRYGIADAQSGIHSVPTPGGTIWEFPPSVVRLGRIRLPIAGGGYFRLYPWRLTRHLMRGVQRSGRPLMFYTHPWEVDPDQPRLKAGSRFGRFRHNVNLATTERKLKLLMNTFRFAPMCEVLQHVGIDMDQTARSVTVGRRVPITSQ